MKNRYISPSRHALWLVAPLALVGACEDSPAGDPVNGNPTCRGSQCLNETVCTDDDACADDQLCSDGGICVPKQTGIEVGNLAGAGGDLQGMGGGPGCLDVDVEFDQVIPTVALLLDRSISMKNDKGFDQRVNSEIQAGTYTPWGCPASPGDPLDSPNQANPDWRWNVLRSVLFNPDTGVVPQLDDQVRFGMTLYTSRDPDAPNLCPDLIDVDFGLSNSSQLLSAMQCDDLGRDTPTRESLSVTAQNLHQVQTDGPKMIILATDGAPDNCECPDFGTAAPAECQASSPVVRDGQMLAPHEAELYDVVEEARRIYEEWGIVVSVIDLSSPDNMTLHAHLQEVAQAGGGELFDGLHPTGLSDAFTELVGEVRSCEVDLNGKITEGKEEQGTVLLDGKLLSFVSDSGDDGYRTLGPSRIELVGKPCEQLKEGDHDLSISFPCDVFQVIR